MLDPDITRLVLGVALALHLAHHRWAHRHISFVEVFAAALLVAPTVYPLLLVIAHSATVVVLVLGSIGIGRLSPQWEGAARARTPSG